MLKPIVEIDRFVSASPEPHSVAVLRGKEVWIASRATRRIDVMERDGWRKIDEIETPGMPWGMNYGGGAVVMTCGEAPDDDRRVRRYIPGDGFDDVVIECPDDAGSHLALYGGRVLLGLEFSGVVKSLGSSATGFNVRDRVYGTGDMLRDGAWAELVAIDHRLVARIRHDLSFADAAAYCEARGKQSRQHRGDIHDAQRSQQHPDRPVKLDRPTERLLVDHIYQH